MRGVSVLAALALIGVLTGCGSTSGEAVRSFGRGLPAERAETLRSNPTPPATDNGPRSKTRPSLLDPARRGHPVRREFTPPAELPPPLPANFVIEVPPEVGNALKSYGKGIDPSQLCFQTAGRLGPYSQIQVANEPCPTDGSLAPDPDLWMYVWPIPDNRPNVNQPNRKFWLVFNGLMVGKVEEALSVVATPDAFRPAVRYRLDSLCSGEFTGRCEPLFDEFRHLRGFGKS